MTLFTKNSIPVENEKKGGFRNDSVFSRKIKAGKRRTYFFDVKSTRSNDYFLTITESKKRPDDSYERYKIFLYKEDFNKFIETLTETLNHIKTELMPNFDFDAFNRREEFSEHPQTREETSKTPPAPQGSPEENLNQQITSSPPPTPPLPPGNEDDLKW